ncbi:hypothetical protein V1283_005891 [Bradyrhizobium sp. AZCC 2262]
MRISDHGDRLRVVQALLLGLDVRQTAALLIVILLGTIAGVYVCRGVLVNSTGSDPENPALCLSSGSAPRGLN